MTDDTHIVECTSCKKTFDGFAPEQANGCAADVRDTMIVGYYGSAVADMTQFDFVPGKRPADLGNGQICDPCITTLRESGALAQGRTNVGEFDGAIPENLTLLDGA